MPLKGCVHWNLRAFTVRTMASMKDGRRERVWSREEEHPEREEEVSG